jgi:hypothetical protein
VAEASSKNIDNDINRVSLTEKWQIAIILSIVGRRTQN